MVITKIYTIKSALNLAIDYIIKREKILLSLFKSHQSTD
ncbi:relaxase, partial [Lactobacillus iners]|nr:relaxase [Lactobacillus iners]